jgi:hypothetical protein
VVSLGGLAANGPLFLHSPETNMNRLLQSLAIARVAACIACAAWLLASGHAARADDDAKKVVEAAVKAHGGADKLAKQKKMSSISKGKMKINIMDGIDATMEMRAGGKKFRQDIKFSIMGMDFEQSVAYDGKEMWIALNGKIMQTLSTKEDLELIREAVHAEEVADLDLLDNKDIELSIIGDDKVGDTPVVGVRVSQKGYKDVSLYFDKKTHRLKRIDSRGLDFQSRMEVAQERIIDEYKEVDGVLQPAKITMNRDGKKFIEFEFASYELVDKLDDSTWKKPE